MKLKRSMLIAVLMLSTPFTALALTPDESRPDESSSTESRPSIFGYNYADLNYVNYDDGGSGLLFAGSWDIKPEMNIFASLGSATDYNQIDVGIAKHHQWYGLERTDLNYFVGLVYGDVDTGNFSSSDTGLFIGVGLRTLVIPKLELAGNMRFHTLFDNDIVFAFTGRYQFSEKWYGHIGLDLADNAAFTLGARYDY